ncbi:hypothetical protein AB1Y20_002923 [Prymnesium parvum]|uniref:Uncharacterized protein n=1 Tax=Prymnesium parvum TaxID=97485 RepID=A0AB34JCL3_PRYPA
MRAGVLEPRPAERKRQHLLVPRRTLLRGAAAAALGALALLGLAALCGAELHALRGEAAAERLAHAQAAHRASVSLARAVMELQAELDAREAHDREALRLHSRLERETLPGLAAALRAACRDCPPAAAGAVEAAVRGFEREVRHHSEVMLGALQRGASHARTKAQSLVGEIAAVVRADRARMARLRHGGGAGWSDADLEAPLRALLRRLSQPNATIDIAVEKLTEWEHAASDALLEGGAFGENKRRLVRLVEALHLPPHDVDLRAFEGADDPLPPFLNLLSRARLHRHAPELRAKLLAWERGLNPEDESQQVRSTSSTTVWDVVELVEKLRAQRVLQISFLRLEEHDWAEMVHGAAAEHSIELGPIHFDASH